MKRHGRVCYANDVNEALVLMVEKDFDYYFVDADIPHAQAFLKHLEHDPKLAPPRAVVLLTDNEEEDCGAWSADTFITKSKIYDDLPYIFSHLRRKQSDKADVVRIAPDLWSESDAAPRGETKRRLYNKERAGISQSAGEKTRPLAFPEQSEQNEEHRGVNGAVSPAGNGGGRRLRFVVAAFLVVVAGLWLFVWGPFGRNSAGNRSKISGRKSVEAETSGSTGVKNEPTDLKDRQESTTIVKPENSPAPVNQSAASVPGDPGSQPTTPVPAPSPAPVPTRPPEPANHAPTVSISGPATVKARDTATYTAVASDLDGDPMTYSWGSSTKSTAWSTPGLYSVSVKVTDSHGASASDSISVRVI